MFTILSPNLGFRKSMTNRSKNCHKINGAINEVLLVKSNRAMKQAWSDPYTNTLRRQNLNSRCPLLSSV